MSEQLPVLPHRSPETQPAAPRFVVFGTRTGGVYGAADAFEKHLADLGFEDANVVAVRDAARIDDAFYGRGTGQRRVVVRPELPAAETAAPVRLWRKAADLILRRETAPAAQTPDAPTAPADLPQGVVVFPEMRQRTLAGSGMFIPAPREHIADLCEQNGVPVIFMEDVQSADDLALAVDRFAIERGQSG